MPRKPQPQQPPDNDSGATRPDVDEFFKPLTHSSDGGETFERKESDRGRQD